MDVDGTLTDGKIYMSKKGESVKTFNVKDGYGIKNILPLYNITPIIITGRTSEILIKRCQELNLIYLYQGIDNKINKLTEIIKDLGVTYENIAYIGDDINDLECMKICGICGCPGDAIEEVLRISTFKSTKCGGDGAVREFIDWIINYQFTCK